MKKLYLDTEAPLTAAIEPYSVQIAIGEDKPRLLNPFDWAEMGRLRALLYDPETYLVAFNAPFDLHKLYTLFHILNFGHEALKSRKQLIPPFRCKVLDLLIHCKRHPWLGAFAAKKSVCVLRRIPKHLADSVATTVANKLSGKLPFPVVLKKKTSPVKGSKNLVTITLSLAGGIGLKHVISLISGKVGLMKVGEAIELAEVPGGREETFLPTIQSHELELYYDNLWERNFKTLQDKDSLAHKYALDDIRYLKILDAWLGNPEPDVHDTSAAIVAYTRYVGFPFDRKALTEHAKRLRQECNDFETLCQSIGFNPASSKQRLAWLNINLLDDCPRLTKADQSVLEEVLKEGLIKSSAENLLRDMVQYGGKHQRLVQIEYLLKSATDRAHFELDPWGTSSGRMAGRGKFNAQGISKDSPIRSHLKTSFLGDFEGLEVAVAASILEDEVLTKDLLDGVNIHLKYACGCFPDMPPYPEAFEILHNKRHPRHSEIKEKRNRIKSVVFARLYFSTDLGISRSLGISLEEVQRDINPKFYGVYPGFTKFREELEGLICTADTRTWTASSVSHMAGGIVNLLGETRYCLFEKAVAEVLWTQSEAIAQATYANNIVKDTVRNAKKGKQTEYQAIRSACLGAAINIQSSLFRSLGNFLIQSVGSTLNKTKDALLWETLGLPILNLHDEIVVPSGFEEEFLVSQKIIQEFLSKYRELVPALKIEIKRAATWDEK